MKDRLILSAIAIGCLFSIAINVSRISEKTTCEHSWKSGELMVDRQSTGIETNKNSPWFGETVTNTTYAATPLDYCTKCKTVKLSEEQRER